MSYVSRGEKVFKIQDAKDQVCSPEVKRSDHRLKRFHSTSDKRAWDFCEVVRYRHFYELISGSQTCLNVPTCHQYVPLNDLINIITAEKDARIKELELKLKQCCGDRGNQGFSEATADTSQELAKSRDMLRQAMHKLQNIDEIINEKRKLECRLRCSEERVKTLEEKRKRLEKELAELRSKSEIRIDLERTQEMLSRVTKTGNGIEGVEGASTERDRLLERINNLEKELDDSRRKENEIEVLRKRSKSDTISIEEMSKENECYRKKLASMKCIEKQIQELKRQGLALAEKYKKESRVAAEQIKKMCNAAKEVQALREERDGLLKRVEELASHEGQLRALQCKLKRVDAVIAENELLNNKLLALDKLEKENEYLRCRLDQIQEMEMNAIEDKERILQLQRAVADQEEEMKDLLCQIERLTSGRGEEELDRLKCELSATNSKLKLCEEQLAEIPMLEAEIDELRKRLQCCCEELEEKKTSEHGIQRIGVRFSSKSRGTLYKNENNKASSVLGIQKEEKDNFDRGKPGSCREIVVESEVLRTSSGQDTCEKTEAMTCEEVQNLLHSSKGIISCVLEDMIEHQKEMEELEMCNKAMKWEIDDLKSKMGLPDEEELRFEIENLKKVLQEKDLEIGELKKCCMGAADAEALKELNENMKAELDAACGKLKNVAELEKLVLLERQARCRAEKAFKDQVGSNNSRAPTGGVTEEDPEFNCCRTLQLEIDDLKLQIAELNKLTNELKKENELLRELQQPCPDFSKELDEKCALENLLSLLQAELDAFKGQRLSEECEALRTELKRVLEQNCQLKALVDCYRQRLDLEKKGHALVANAEKEGDVTPGQVSEGKGSETEWSSPEPTSVKGEQVTTSEFAREAEKEEEIPKPTEELDKDLLSELARLRKLVDEKEKALADQRAQCEETLKARDEELKTLQRNLDRTQEENKDLEKAAPKSKENSTGPTQDDCEKRLREMEQQNAEKLKKLMDQHQKELTDREKAYNENMNAMKAGYETDIRKLAERHKASIMKLQGLHEDEVNELNTNHETQMETMQTQSEMAMNDILRGSAAKIKNLTQQHDKQIKGAEEKIIQLQDNLTRSQQEVENLRKNALKNDSELKEKHNRDMQKMKKSSSRRLSIVTSKYEALLAEEKTKSEARIDTLKKSLKDRVERERGDAACNCNFARKKPCNPRDSTSSLDFNQVLEKILDQGLESLSFNEIALVHRKACCALKEIVLQSNVTSVLEPSVGEGCPDVPLVQADKEQLLRRIVALEREIVFKQRQTQEAILGMEVAIKKERCRLQELKAVLETEQQKNSQLNHLLTSQTKLHSDLREERDRLGNEAALQQNLCLEKTKQLNQEKEEKKYLEEEIERLRTTVQKLCDALETERRSSNMRFPEGETSGLVQALHMKLEHSANQERKLALQLEKEVQYRIDLQCQVQALRQTFRKMVNLPAVEKDVATNPVDTKIAKEKKNIDEMRGKKSRTKTSGGRKPKK